MGYGHAKGQPGVPAYTPFVAAGFFAAPAEVLTAGHGRVGWIVAEESRSCARLR